VAGLSGVRLGISLHSKVEEIIIAVCRFSRRETLTMLGAFAVRSAAGATDSSLRFSGLDHLAIAADTGKSMAFITVSSATMY
jgi:hypothetical protein